jgi:RHS repeat-associated protein
VLTLTDGLGTTTFSYDNLARATQVQHVINSSTYTIGYQYNLAGEVTSLTYPSGRVVQPSYDAIGRLSSLSSGTTTYASSFSYNSAFAPTNLTMGNGVAVTLGYSANRLQLQSINYAGASTIFSATYGYAQNGGNNGQITSIADSVNSGRSIAYTYDALNRLSTEVTTGSTSYPAWGLSFTYDRYGNRTAQTVTAGTAPSNSVAVSATTNQLTASGYAYDANGNMTNDAVNSIAYDAENRLVSSTGSAGSGTYFYRASGLRAVKVSGGTTTVYLFDGNRDIAEYTNGALANEYIYMGDKMIASHLSGTLYYHASDHQSIRVNMDASGNVVGQKGQYSYGEDWYPSSLTNRHFTSYERDSESSNDNALHRFYVNRLGRFSSTDPIPGGGQDPQRFNLYGYAHNDSVNNADPDGRYTPSLNDCPLGLACGCDSFYEDCGGGIDCVADPDLCDGSGAAGGGGVGSGSCNPDFVEGSSCPPPEPPPPPPPTKPECFCQLKYRPVDDDIARKVGATHSFWYIQDFTGKQLIISAGPTGPRGTGFLNDFINANLHSGVDNITANTYFDSGLGPSTCLSAEIMEATADAWRNNRTVYHPFPGPNSNSFAHYLGLTAGFLLNSPPGAHGWFWPVN